MKAAMNLQDSFLNQVRKENSEVKVLLVNGNTLRGTVKGFDNFTLILNSRNGQHLVYKHAIAQILHQRSTRTSEEHVPADLSNETGSESNSETPSGENEVSESTEAGLPRADQQARPVRDHSQRPPRQDRPRGDRPAGAGDRSPRPPRQDRQPNADRGNRERQERPANSEQSAPGGERTPEARASKAPKKEGFNTLDLSKLKIEESI